MWPCDVSHANYFSAVMQDASLVVFLFCRLLVKFPELNYQLKIKVCIDKWVWFIMTDASYLIFITKIKLHLTNSLTVVNFWIFQGIWRCCSNPRVTIYTPHSDIFFWRRGIYLFASTSHLQLLPLLALPIGRESLTSLAPTPKSWTWRSPTMAVCRQSLSTWWVTERSNYHCCVQVIESSD